jgi:hypothetical protein
MRCPVCDQLHDELSLACKEEASASLQQRYDVMLGSERKAPGRVTSQQHQETILSSRKKQVKIASRLEEHQTLAHSA